MRIEIVKEAGSGFGLKLVPDSDMETEQLRELKSLGLESKVTRVEFAVPRRRNSREGHLALLDAIPAED